MYRLAVTSLRDAAAEYATAPNIFTTINVCAALAAQSAFGTIDAKFTVEQPFDTQFTCQRTQVKCAVDARPNSAGKPTSNAATSQ